MSIILVGSAVLVGVLTGWVLGTGVRRVVVAWGSGVCSGVSNGMIGLQAERPTIKKSQSVVCKTGLILSNKWRFMLASLSASGFDIDIVYHYFMSLY
jgi:hypothetical protein